MGEQLLYFLLSALRGPVQSAKDFDKVWPIFDSAQSRDFRKIVQGIITVLLPVTKARIALGRRKFLKNANGAVQRQSAWSNLANEMTAEFRGLCAEEAYLHQELEKLQGMRNKAKLEEESWDDRISNSSQNSHIVSKATRLWESLLARKSEHEVLASGPIEDLIAHREHRYRISGSSLVAATDLSSHVPYSDVLSVRAGEISPPIDSHEPTDPSQFQGNMDALHRTEDRSGRFQTTVDVAEILRRWTHALQRIHKQSLHLTKANDGEGPELLRCAFDGGTGGHAESLAATLSEHRQHLASIQGLINQLKEAVPTMQKSIAELTEEVNSISQCPMNEYSERSMSHVHAHSSGRSPENNSDEALDMTSRLSSTHLEKASSSPAQKLPHLFSLTPNSAGKCLHTTKQCAVSTKPIQTENLVVGKPIDQPSRNDNADSALQDGDGYYAQNIRRSVREAALSKPSSNAEWPEDKSSDDGSEHFFIPLSAGVQQKEVDAVPNRRKQRLFSSPPHIHTNNNIKEQNYEKRFSSASSTISDDSNGLADYENQINSSFTVPGAQSRFPDIDESLDQVFSPPLLLDSSFFADTHEDLLAPLSETDTALMER